MRLIFKHISNDFHTRKSPPCMPEDANKRLCPNLYVFPFHRVLHIITNQKKRRKNIKKNQQRNGRRMHLPFRTVPWMCFISSPESYDCRIVIWEIKHTHKNVVAIRKVSMFSNNFMCSFLFSLLTGSCVPSLLPHDARSLARYKQWINCV